MLVALRSYLDNFERQEKGLLRPRPMSSNYSWTMALRAETLSQSIRPSEADFTKRGTGTCSHMYLCLNSFIIQSSVHATLLLSFLAPPG